MRIGGLAAVLALAGAVPMSSAPDQQKPPTVFRASANHVRVDVVVRDRSGNIVKGLKAEDFQVTEDGKAQQVTSFDFEEIATDALPATTTTPPMLGLEQLQNAAQRSAMSAVAANAPTAAVKPEDLPGRRLIVLLFDTSSMQPEEITRAVKSADEYIEKQMSPADLVAVASVGQSLTILRDFTSDRELLKSTLAAFDVTAGTGFEQPIAETVDAADIADPADLPLDDSEFGIFNNDRRLRAMKVLAEALAPIEQKKAILYFSSGMSRTGADNQVELRAVINAANKANTSIYPIDSRGLTAVVPGGAAGRGGRGGGGASVFSGRAMLSQFSSLNASQETLTTLAADTGGQAFIDTNDFGPAFTRVQRDMAAYYLLGYNSSNVTQDGKFRRIAVRLKNTSLGYRVESRNGYYAAADFAHLKKEDRERQLQEQIASAMSATDLPVVASTSWFRIANDRFYVPLSLAVPGSVLRLPTATTPLAPGAPDRRTASVDLLGVVMDEQGRAVGRIRDTMQIPAAQVADMATKQLQYQSGVSLPAGHFKVKVAVRENTDGAMGTFEFPITIPDLKLEPLKVSPIVFSTQLRFTRGGGPGPRGGGPGGGGGGRGGPGGGMPPDMGGRGFDSQRGGGGAMWGAGAVNPLLRGGQEIVQSLSHVVTQGQSMYFYYEVYDPATALPTPAAGAPAPASPSAGAAPVAAPVPAPRLQTSLAFYRGRVKVFESPVIERTQIDDIERKAAIFQFQLPASELKPGLYTCQVNVVDEVSGRFAFPRIAIYVKEQPAATAPVK